MEARVAKKSGEQRDTAHPGWGGGVGARWQNGLFLSLWADKGPEEVPGLGSPQEALGPKGSPTNPLPHLTFRNALLKPSGSSEFWGGHEPPFLLGSPCNEPFSAPDSNISVSWASLCVGHGNVCPVTDAHVTNFREPLQSDFSQPRVECLSCTEKENPFMWPFFA